MQKHKIWQQYTELGKFKGTKNGNVECKHFTGAYWHCDMEWLIAVLSCSLPLLLLLGSVELSVTSAKVNPSLPTQPWSSGVTRCVPEGPYWETWWWKHIQFHPVPADWTQTPWLSHVTHTRGLSRVYAHTDFWEALDASDGGIFRVEWEGLQG